MEKIVCHTLEPVFQKDSQILILGTMPSPKSRESGFYYSHPQNRFWGVISELMGEKLPTDNTEKKAFLYRNHIALWDVLKSCSIDGADDSSIKNPLPNQINEVLVQAPIKAVFTTGTKATSLYKRFCVKETGIASIHLPSTSPANCRHFSYEKLLEEYRGILPYLDAV